jgi:transcriptional regulator with XRE-family HTH domain
MVAEGAPGLYAAGMTTEPLHIGPEIRRRRKARGLSGADLAEILGVEPSTVSRVESGEIKLRVDDLPIWAAALGTSVVALVSPRRAA